MEIEETSFDLRDVEQYCMGAGIIPISICPETNTPHFLLGRERWVPSWRGSCRWSGFEGSRKECESTRMSAAREFVEESMGCARICPRDRPYDRIRDVIQCLEHHHYWKRIVLRIDTDRHIERYHTTFLVPVVWSEEIPQRFFETRMEVEQIDRLLQEWNYTRPFNLGELGEIIGPIDVTETAVHVQKCLDTSPCILRRPWKRDTDVLMATFTDPLDIQDIVRWNGIRDRLTRAVQRCKHPSVSTEYDERWRLLQHVDVNVDHLEKDQVRWWSIDDLDAVIVGQGQMGVDRFRPYFLPVLQTALTLVRTRMETIDWTTTTSSQEQEQEDVCNECEPSEPDPSIPTGRDELPLVTEP